VTEPSLTTSDGGTAAIVGSEPFPDSATEAVTMTAPTAADGMLEAAQGLTTIFGETLGQGGLVLLALALLSVAALAILLVKLWQFARLQLGSDEPVETAIRRWYAHQPQAAMAAVRGSTQPTARLLEHAFRGLSLPGANLGLLREELTRFATAELEQLHGWLRALEVIAALSPLLGLLGTVLGMIEAFRALELVGAQVDPAILSGGIWQALLTTAAGLGIAIPVVLVHSWLERRVERCGHQMEDALTRVFTRDLASAIENTKALGSTPTSSPSKHANLASSNPNKVEIQNAV
jgi:biopolymer transport protein ExbB